MGSSGSQPVTQQTTQTRDPWTVAQPHLAGIMNQAATMFGAGTGYNPYLGNTTAALPADTQASMQAIRNLVAGENYGSSALNAARTSGENMVNNYGLSPQMQALYDEASTQQNPFLQGVINQQVSQANAAASGMGRYGSGAHDAAIAQAIAPTLSADYARRQQERQSILEGGMQRQGQWAQVIPTLDQARFGNLAALSAVGDTQRSYDQALLDQQLKIWNAQQAQQWETLQRYAALVQGAGSLGGSQITSSPGATQPGTLQKALGGAAAGAGIGSMFLPGIGTGVGAAAGGLLGLL